MAAIISLVMAGLAVVLFAACLVLLLLTGDYQRAAYGAGGTVSGLVCLGVGLLVARRQPGSPIGWLLLGWACLIPLTGVAVLYAVLDYRVRHGALPFGPVAVFAQPAQLGIAVLAALTVLLFPDGRLPRRAWHWALWIFLAAAAVFAARQVTGQALDMARRPPRIGPAGSPLPAPGPVPPAAAVLDRLGTVAAWVILGCWLIFIARQAASFRPATGNRRQQLKWLLFGAACCAVATAVTVLAANGASASAQAVQDAADLGAAALPVGIGIGIVKYRLYDIDRIISRTLGYAIVTGVLVGVYAGLVLLAGLVVPSSSPTVVAGATLVVAALFRPLHRRVQQAVDRRFNRAHYDAGKVVDEFAARLQESVDLAAIRDDLASTVQDALEPAHLSIWLRRLFSQTAGAWRPGSGAPAVWQEIKDRPRRWAGHPTMRGSAAPEIMR
jgi:hypothetical protein